MEAVLNLLPRRYPDRRMLHAVVTSLALLLPAWAAQAQTAPVPVAPTSAVLVSGPAGQVTRMDVELTVNEIVPPADRPRFWASPDAVPRMARSLYAQRVLAAEAAKAGVENTPQGAAALRLARERTLTELLMQQRVQAATPNDTALEAFVRSEMRARPERFMQPEEVHVRHILLPVARDGSNDAAVKAQAQALIDELRKGADFAALARAQSADKGSAQRGGDLGFFPRGKMAPEFEEAAFALKQPGELSVPVKSNFGYHVIELRERKPAQTRPFEQVLPEAREELLGKINAQERRQAWDGAETGAQVDEAAVKAWAQERQAEALSKVLPAR